MAKQALQHQCDLSIIRGWMLRVGLAGLLLLLNACHIPEPEITQQETYHKDILPGDVSRDYLLSPGDQIEVIYQFSTDLEDHYRLAIGDQLRVEFMDYPQLDRTLDVRPDGYITVPYEGDVRAVGLTPPQLAAEINRKYSNLLRRPQATVNLVRFGQQVRELKDAIKTNDRGMSRLVRVNPDGKITLPLLKEPVKAAALTIEELHRTVNDAYKRIVPNLDATTTLLAATGNLIYVFGAVQKPGFYELQRPTTTIQALSMAGGMIPDGEPSNVLWVTRDEERHPVGRIIDVKQIIETGNAGQDVLMRQGDVLYVSYNPLAQAAITADYIWRIIPVNLSIFFNPLTGI